VILDLHLPNLSGETILNTIRGDTRLGKVRVVVTTADAALGEFMREAADFVMIKPISYVQLRELCRRLNSKTE
jgi:CheY-like chemotaxis protein